MNNVFIDLGKIYITYYSLFLLLAVLLGGALVIKEANKFHFNQDFIANLIFWTVVFGMIGARIYYVLFNWSYYRLNMLEIFKVWEGGLAIHGGIIVAFIFIVSYSARYKIKLIKLTDILVVGLILGQAIGRWGNFFNQEAYGSEVSRAFLEKWSIPNFIIEGMNIYGNYYHPTFLYESLWCLLGFVFLILVRKYKYLKIGQLTALYFIWYSAGRFFIESLRMDSLMLFSFKMAQLVSILLFVIGIILFIVKTKGSRFENLYHEMGENNEIKF